MKRKMLAFLLCFVLLCVPFLKVQAESNGPWYYEVRNGSAFILSYQGDAYGHVEIPATIDGYPVTGIGNGAFLGRKLTSVTIPDTVTKIVDAAFAHCPNLITVNIPKNVSVIDGSAFMDCESLTGFYVDLQNQFFAHDTLGVLYTKNGLTLVQVPGSMKGKFVIPNGVMQIDSSAFQGCSGLTEIVIADSVRMIGGYAFCDCTGLTRLKLPALVDSIGSNAFNNCAQLTGIDVAEENKYFCSDENGNLYSKDKSQILYAPGAFTGDYVVPEGTTQIGPDFFEYCSGLTSVTIPEGVTEIGHYAFHGCENLQRVTIAESVCDIGAYAFENCPKLTTVNIPEQVTHIRWGLFRGCESLTQLPIHDKVTIIDDFAFAECNGLTDIVIPASVEYVGHYAFRECKGLRNIYFCGDAPEFVNYEDINGSFAETKATAYYHKGTDGWTAENKSKTGGWITWVELEHIVFEDGPDSRCAVCGEKAEKNTVLDDTVFDDQDTSGGSTPERPDGGTDVPIDQDTSGGSTPERPDGGTDVPIDQDTSGGNTPERPDEGTDVPIDQDVPGEENPKTADRITEMAGILLVLVAAGFGIMLKMQRSSKQKQDLQ